MLETELCGLKLKNPLILASGILGSDVSSLNRIAEHAGAVVTKSVGLEAREGYKNPTVLNWSCGLINAVGLASPSATDFALMLKEYSRLVPLIVSIYGDKPENFKELVKVFDVADAFEINLSCPHANGFEIGRDIDLSVEIVKTVKRSTSKPIIAKISAMHNYIELAKALQEAGVDAITITNTLRGMKIDIITKKPILSNLSGGVSGEAIKPIAIKCVWDLYEELDIPIIGCGGITTFKDVLEFILAGATAVEIGSAFFYSYNIIYCIKESLYEYLKTTGERIKDLIGLAHR